MTRAELEHAIRAACDVAADDEVYVFGSQAILGQYPDAPAPLRMSAEADIVPKNFPERWSDIDGMLGELSQFHQTHGFYVRGVSIETACSSPGWQQRCILVRNSNTRHHARWCLEAHDLGAAKLAAHRDKDFAFVRTLLREYMISAKTLARRFGALDIEPDNKKRLLRWIRATASEA